MYANYRDIAKAVAKFEKFDGNSSRAVIASNGEYYVYSYNTLIAVANFRTGGMGLNTRKYSQTTSRLQNIIRNAWAEYDITELD
jgi:hypothetical protein